MALYVQRHFIFKFFQTMQFQIGYSVARIVEHRRFRDGDTFASGRLGC